MTVFIAHSSPGFFLQITSSSVNECFRDTFGHGKRRRSAYPIVFSLPCGATDRDLLYGSLYSFSCTGILNIERHKSTSNSHPHLSPSMRITRLQGRPPQGYIVCHQSCYLVFSSNVQRTGNKSLNTGFNDQHGERILRLSLLAYHCVALSSTLVVPFIHLCRMDERIAC